MNKTFLYGIIGAEKDIIGNYTSRQMTVKDIATKWKVTERQIYNIVKKYGVTRSASKLKKASL